MTAPARQVEPHPAPRHGAGMAGAFLLPLLVALAMPLASSLAQTTADPPAVPRATPVVPAGPGDRPAVARPVPIPIPPPPSSTPVAKPVDPSAVKDPATEGKAREDLFLYADLLFSRKEWKLAATQYQVFLKQHPDSPNRPAAWYRLGECYLAADQEEDAMTSFTYLVDRFKKGPFVGAAAYRLATAKFAASEHQLALDFFTIAATEAPAAELRLQALYSRARCLHLLKNADEALAAYRAVVDYKPAVLKEGEPKDGNRDAPVSEVPFENPFAERASLSIARLLSDKQDTEAAFAQYLGLTVTARDTAIRQEALARAGLLAAQLGKTEESNRLLDAVLKIDDGGEWKGTAQVALVFNLYAAGEYEKVVQVYAQGIGGTPDDVRPKLLMMVGNSMRQTEASESAISVYRIIEKNYRDLPLAAEAIFRKLQCLDQTGNLDLVNEIERFVKSQKEIDAESPFIDLAWLMKGEWHFQRSDWAAAAAAYDAVRGDAIPEKYRAARLYKLGWAQSESEDPAKGIDNLSRFLEQHPDDPFVPSALAKRAATQQGIGNNDEALSDYRAIVEVHPEAEQLEFALEQIAYIHNVERDIPAMVAAYRKLLERFPETAGAAEAYFYIGGGHYEQKQYAESVEPLRKARELDADGFGARSTEVLILALYRLKEVDALATEVDQALDAKPPVKVPIPVLNYIGEVMFQKSNFKASERYFSAASTPTKPADTPSAVWDYLGRARHKIGVYGGAVLAFDHYLSIVSRPADRCEGYLNKGHALLAKKDFDGADVASREALKLVHQGKLNARGRLLRGDIAHARGDNEAAAREYFITAQIFVGDPEITPQALAKAARAYRGIGDAAKVAEIEKQLSMEYPHYRLPEDE